MKYLEKQKAITLRKSGRSVKEIAKEIGVAKSSVSIWVRNIVISRGQLQFLREKGFTSELIEKRRKKRLFNEEVKRNIIMSEAGNDIKKISENDLRLIGLCLYWGEGGKTRQGSVRLSNSDPAVIKVMMRFFREICMVREEKFRGHIHIHSHLDVKRAEEYWSSVSNIPTKQFYKTYTKQSIASKQKKDNLPYGTFDIYASNTILFLQIIGQIEKIKKLLHAV